MKKILTFISILILSQSVFAIDCARPIDEIWTGNDNAVIYIKHSDGYGASRVEMSDVNNNEHTINRMLSIILAAKMAGKTVKFRYADSGASCTPNSNSSQDFMGVWVK